MLETLKDILSRELDDGQCTIRVVLFDEWTNRELVRALREVLLRALREILLAVSDTDTKLTLVMNGGGTDKYRLAGEAVANLGNIRNLAFVLQDAGTCLNLAYSEQTVDFNLCCLEGGVVLVNSDSMEEVFKFGTSDYRAVEMLKCYNGRQER